MNGEGIFKSYSITPTTQSDTKFAVLLLAAGSSKRLGRPKQVLSYHGTDLLTHSLREATASRVMPVLVVLGAYAAQLKEAIDFEGAEVVVNPEWEEGMGSSIRFGMETLIHQYPEVEGVVIMVCDQPKVSQALLQSLITAHQTSRKPIIACGYADTFGPPVFFHKSYFTFLLQLKNDVGARSVVRDHPDAVEIIPFPEGNLDIDTEEDLRASGWAAQE